MRWLIFILAFSLCGFTFVEKRMPKASIVLPDHPDAQEKIAAETLQSYIRRMSGAVLPIRSEKENVSGAALYVGDVRALPQEQRTKLQLDQKLLFGNSARDGFVLAGDGERFFLAGYRPVGTRYAVHCFLESFGVRHFFANEAGTVVPRRDTLAWREQNEYHQPSYAGRRHYSWNRRAPEVVADDVQWGIANGMSEQSIRGFSGHNFARIWNPKKHPELFPSVPGKKTTYQVCIANPKTWEIGAAWAEEQIRKNPNADVVSFSPNDGYGHCACADCQKLGSVARRNVFLINKIGERFWKRHPDKMLLMWAYAEGAKTPPELEIDGFSQHRDRVLVVIYDFFTPVPLPRLLTWWQKTTHHIEATQNWYCFHPLYGAVHKPVWRELEDKYRAYRRQGLTMLRTQCKSDWALSGFSRYLSARLMWDTSLHTEDVMRDFAHSMFPSCADEAYNLIALYRRAGYGLTLENFMAHALSLMERMRLKINTPEERLRWDFYAAYFGYIDLVETLGDKPGKESREALIARQKKLTAYLKGMTQLRSLEVTQRMYHHEKILERFAKMPRKEARRIFAEVSAESLSHEKLVERLRIARKHYPEPDILLEYKPF